LTTTECCNICIIFILNLFYISDIPYFLPENSTSVTSYIFQILPYSSDFNSATIAIQLASCGLMYFDHFSSNHALFYFSP